MVKKIKNEKNKEKGEESKIKKSENVEKDNINKEQKKKESVLHQNIKRNRELAKKKKNKTIKKKNYTKKIDKTNNKIFRKEEDESKNDNNIKEEEEKEKEDEDKDEDINEEEPEEMDEEEEEEDINEEEHEEIDEKDKQEEEEEEENEEAESEEKQDKNSDNEQNNEKEEQKEHKDLNLLKNAISEHYYTFQYPKDLYTLLYASLIFKWIDTTKILILCNTPKEGYKIDIFLRQFRFNTIYLDKEMPLNTNNHFYAQYLKNTYQICIINLEYSEKSKNFAKEILNNTKVPITIIYFDCFSQPLLEYHSYHPNTRSIYHFISNKDNFLDAYENLDENINFNEFVFDREQMEHLRYRAEDMLNGIRKSDIKKEKMRKINIELLHSKKMQKFFNDNPKERENIIRNIDENTIKNFSPSVTFLPSYLIHSENNVIADAIKKEYKDTKRNKNKRRKKQKKMEQYFEALDKGDGSQNLIKF
jgi:hypothetical protein